MSEVKMSSISVVRSVLCLVAMVPFIFLLIEEEKRSKSNQADTGCVFAEEGPDDAETEEVSAERRVRKFESTPDAKKEDLRPIEERDYAACVRAYIKFDEGWKREIYNIGGVDHIGVGVNLEVPMIPSAAAALLRLVPGRDETLCTEEWYKSQRQNTQISVIHRICQGGLTDAQVLAVFECMIAETEKDLRENFPWFKKLGPAAKLAVTNLRFATRDRIFRKFRKMAAAFQRGDLSSAGDEIVDSRWARAIQKFGSKRPDRLKTMVQTGQVTDLLRKQAATWRQQHPHS